MVCVLHLVVSIYFIVLVLFYGMCSALVVSIYFIVLVLFYGMCSAFGCFNILYSSCSVLWYVFCICLFQYTL